jgi:hypothetical protein
MRTRRYPQEGGGGWGVQSPVLLFPPDPVATGYSLAAIGYRLDGFRSQLPAPSSELRALAGGVR